MSFRDLQIAWHPWTQILSETVCDKCLWHQLGFVLYRLKIKVYRLFCLLSEILRQPAKRFLQETWKKQSPRMLLYFCRFQPVWSIIFKPTKVLLLFKKNGYCFNIFNFWILPGVTCSLRKLPVTQICIFPTQTVKEPVDNLPFTACCTTL